MPKEIRRLEGSLGGYILNEFHAVDLAAGYVVVSFEIKEGNLALLLRQLQEKGLTLKAELL